MDHSREPAHDLSAIAAALANSAHDLAASAAALTDAALVRVWRRGPADSCGSCALAPECPDRRECLHLTASVGASTRIDGPFRRFPIGARELGRVAQVIEPFATSDVEAAGVADAAWLRRHGVRSFGAWPVAAGGRCLAVLAVFSRRILDPGDHAAVAALCRLATVAMNMARESAQATVAIGGVEVGSETMADVQRRAILAALTNTGGRLSGAGGAAEILGMKPTTLESRIRRLGLRKPPRLKLR